MIWKRYLRREFAKVALFVIGAFTLLYALVDYSTHTKVFSQGEVRFFEVFCYYLCQSAKNADFFIPVALLIAVIKVLTTLNHSNELTALLASGLSLRRLLRPLWFFGLVSVFFLYFNFQYIQPFAFSYIHRFEQVVFQKRATAHAVKTLPLSDQTLLIYQEYFPEQKRLYDLFWYQDHDALYRMKYLDLTGEIPIGEEVEVIKRVEGQLHRVGLSTTHPFPELHIEESMLAPELPSSSWWVRFFPSLHIDKRTFIQQDDPHSYPLSLLWSHRNAPENYVDTSTMFCYKVTIPWLSLLVICAPVPFCVRFGRHLPIFWIYVFCLSGIALFFTLTNASVILGEGHILSPWYSISLPLLGLLGYFGRRYAKL